MSLDGEDASWGFADKQEPGAHDVSAQCAPRRSSGEYGFGALNEATGTCAAISRISRSKRQGTKYHGFGNRKAMEVIPDGLVNFLNGGHSTTIIEVQEIEKGSPSPRASVDMRRRRSSPYGFGNSSSLGSAIRSPRGSLSVLRAP